MSFLSLIPGEFWHALSTLIVSSSVSVLAWKLGARQQDKQFKAQLEAQEKAFEAQELRKALVARYQQQCKLYEEFESLGQDAYRGSVVTADRDVRRAAILAFRARVLFAFGNEKFANQTMGVLFQYEDINAQRMTGRAPQQEHDDFVAALDSATKSRGQMISSIRSLEARLGLPATVVKAEIDAATEKAIQRRSKMMPPDPVLKGN